MRVACVLITHLRAKAEMRRNGEERGERREERENGVGASHSEEFCSEVRVEGPAAQAVAGGEEVRVEEPSTLIVERGGVGGGAPVVVDYFPGAAGVKVGMTLEQAVSYLAETVVLNADVFDTSRSIEDI